MRFLYFLVVVVCFSSCSYYKQHLLMQSDENYTFDALPERTDENYQLQSNDKFEIEVYTNDGELILDPDYSLRKQMGGGSSQTSKKESFYTLNEDGAVVLPMIGEFSLVGLTIFEANKILAKQYDAFYEGAFVQIRILNRRVSVISGTGSKVVELSNENMKLLEVLALAGGIPDNGKAKKVKVMRLDEGKEIIYNLDFSQVSTIHKNNIQVKSGDVVYIEPVVRPLRESMRDITPILSLVTSALTLYVLIFNLSKSN